MAFEEKFVFTALNAEGLKIGSRVYVADEIGTLRDYVNGEQHIATVTDIKSELHEHRFVVKFDSDINECAWAFAYFVSPPEEKKLKWTDLEVGDIIQDKKHHFVYLVTGIDSSDTVRHICANSDWLTDEELATLWEKVEGAGL